MMKKRVFYGIATILLLGIEILIALYVHDTFIRPYVGDILVVAVIYTFIRTIIPDKYRLLPLYIFLFATSVEVLQLFHIVELFGLEKSEFFRILLGSVFDIKDILCYLVGCLFLGVWEAFSRAWKFKNL